MAEVGINTHAFMVNEINQDDFPLLSRLDNYYEDAEFLPNEIKDLLVELNVLVVRYNMISTSKHQVQEFIAISEEALRNGVGLSAIAD